MTFTSCCSLTASPPPIPSRDRRRERAASSDWAASRLAVAIEQVAVALLAEDEQTQNGPGIVRAHGVMRP
jgi:hypothetical protein